jgi:hypothetical protein
MSEAGLPMNLAIFHYHLLGGGVTRVIESQLAALDAVLEPGQTWRAAVICGGRRQGWDEGLAGRLRSVEITPADAPRLDYDYRQTGAWAGSAEELYGQIRGVLDRLGFAPEETVLHWHNHSLGKNRHVPTAVGRLAGDGFALLLQIHDFAEDYRAANYRTIHDPAALYPQAAHVHYAVLNGRDRGILAEAGVTPERLHFLPNPVPGLGELPPREKARRKLAERFDVGPHQRLVLYPVRCIRRKNIGEALLYATMAPPDTVVGLTLAPMNPVERRYYNRWKSLAAELSPPVRFELGASSGGLKFTESLAASDLILTTSVAEGFGMAFFESWLAGRPLLGRDLPEITGDFREAGLCFDHLRPRVDVPLDWLGADLVRERIAEAYGRTLACYGWPVHEPLDEQLDAKLASGMADYGDLDEELQGRVLDAVCRSQSKHRRLRELNPWIETGLALRREDLAERIGANVEAIERGFSRVPSGRRLLDLYQRVAESPRDESPRPLEGAGQILDRFLGLDRFRLLRS